MQFHGCAWWYSRAMATSADTVTVRMSAGLKQRPRERRSTREVPVAQVPSVRALKGLLSQAGDAVSLFPHLGGG